MLRPNFARIAGNLIKGGFLPSIDKRDVLIEAVIERGIDDIVGRRKPKAVPKFRASEKFFR